MLTPTRRILFENSPYYYPFGNTGNENPLEDFNYRSLDEIKVTTAITIIVFIYIQIGHQPIPYIDSFSGMWRLEERAKNCGQ
jgi:hypothetical protein